MSETPPIRLRYEGEGEFKPYGQNAARLADKHYTIGQDYLLVEYQERSQKSHDHFFAALNEAWANLPEGLAVEYPSVEKLRKHALIKAGFADSQTHVCASKAEAARLEAFLKPIDEFSIVTVTGPTVTRYTAKSQSMRAMGKEQFQQSKDGVLRVVAEMIGATPADLTRSAA